MSLARTSKGDYTWEFNLYFLGNDLRTIKGVVSKVAKTRAILEHTLGQKVIPTERMSAYLKSLEADVDKLMEAETITFPEEKEKE